MPSATSAAVGWSVVFLVAGGFYFVSNQRKNKNRRALSVKGASKPNNSRKEIKSKKSRKDSEPTKDKKEARPSQKTRKTSTENKPSQPSIQPSQDDEKYSVEAVKHSPSTDGNTQATTASRASHKTKSMKSKPVEEKQRDESPDNVTGNEADDELVHDSPKINSKPSTYSQDVSDMLETPPIQPSVLKVTSASSNKMNISVNRKSLKKEERPETKKQRQNKQKAAEAKLARAQEEQERKVKLEAQRRTAREAEGRAAKDGSLFMASQTPQSSVWTAPSPPNHETATTNESLNSESEDHGSNNQEVSVLSEEEQVRHVLKETETWSVVKSKEKRNRTVKASDVKASKPELEIQESKKSDFTERAATLPDRAPYYLVQKEDKYAEDYNSLEDSEWEVS